MKKVLCPYCSAKQNVDSESTEIGKFYECPRCCVTFGSYPTVVVERPKKKIRTSPQKKKKWFKLLVK